MKNNIEPIALDEVKASACLCSFKVASISALLFEGHVNTYSDNLFFNGVVCGFFKTDVIIEVNIKTKSVGFVTGGFEVNCFLAKYEKTKHTYDENGGWFLRIKKGDIVMPIKDDSNEICNLLFVFGDIGNAVIESEQGENCVCLFNEGVNHA